MIFGPKILYTDLYFFVFGKLLEIVKVLEKNCHWSFNLHKIYFR